MGFLRHIFRRDRKSRYTSLRPSTLAVKHPAETADQEIKRLWQTARRTALTIGKRQEAVDICTKLLDLITPADQEHDRGEVFHNRAMYYRMLKDYDSAIKDLQQELHFAQNRGQQQRVRFCKKLIDETRQLQRRAQIAQQGGRKADFFDQMTTQAQKLWSDSPESGPAFDWLFQQLRDSDADIRTEAARLLAQPPKSLEKLVNIYNAQHKTNPADAGLAGRVLGRKIDTNYPNTSPAQVAKSMFGTDIDFIEATCFHCGYHNEAIPIPPNAGKNSFKRRANPEHAPYSVSVICDRCGQEYFLIWDADPT
ncbi:MAG: hypothetical protein JW936_01580 [Sedimentisphaerales bacterium]|nr:hypothetical protein [Sedimentisphaerales bacterium]